MTPYARTADQRSAGLGGILDWRDPLEAEGFRCLMARPEPEVQILEASRDDVSTNEGVTCSSRIAVS
jgi:hypothetical protein